MRNAIFRLSLCMKFHLFRLIQLENAQNSSRLVILLTVKNSSFTAALVSSSLSEFVKSSNYVDKELKNGGKKNWCCTHWMHWQIVSGFDLDTFQPWLQEKRSKFHSPLVIAKVKWFTSTMFTFQKLSTGYNIASVASYVHYDPYCQNIFFWRENSSKTKNRF